MTFLSWQTLAWAAGVSIPPLVALYFLKLKRVVRVVPSTLLWKKSIEDLHVNSPFQRLRSSLLLLLQLLVLMLAALALGKPMLELAQRNEETLILLVDQSASMSVVEADGRTRLDHAKEQAKRCIDNMGDSSRAMVITYCDRASVTSSFDADKQALKRKIDAIEQTQSTTSLNEAITLAEAYAQNIVIGQDVGTKDVGPEKPAAPASVFLFTDGRVEDASQLVVQKFDADKIKVTIAGTRADNVGILAMDARRNYERPELLEVATTIQNFGAAPISFDATLYVDGKNLDIRSVELAAGAAAIPENSASSQPPAGSLAVAAFDPVEFAGGGLVEVVLNVDDALKADDKAWAIVDEPRHVKVLLVTSGNPFLENVLETLPLELTQMSGSEYESAEDTRLIDGERSAFDVVILDRHSTSRLPQGNYLFWGSVPKITGVSTGRSIDDEVIFNWDDTHPVLRHVAAEAIFVNQWLELKLPPEAVSVIDGQTSPVMAYLTRDASQFLISAFSLIIEGEDGGQYVNTSWVTTVDFVVFMQNSVQFLASNISTVSKKSIMPGQPVTLPVPQRTDEIVVDRPDGTSDRVPTAGYQNVHYARTRSVGAYHIEPGVEGNDVFAVNLFNANESFVAPVSTVKLGGAQVQASAGDITVNQPAWPHFLLALLIILILEWVVYNKRVFV